MPPINHEKVQLVKLLLERNADKHPPYQWKQDYSIGNRNYWCLVNPKSEAAGKTIDHYLVLYFHQTKTMANRILSDEDMPKLMVEGMNLLPDLLKLYEACIKVAAIIQALPDPENEDWVTMLLNPIYECLSMSAVQNHLENMKTQPMQGTESIASLPLQASHED